MFVCTKILTLIEVILYQIIVTAKKIVTEICEWGVTHTLTFTRRVCNKVCKWLGPFKSFCKRVCKTIERIEKFFGWICETITDIVFTIITTAFVYLMYIFKWFCFIVETAINLIDVLLCYWFGTNEITKILTLHIKILADKDGNQAISQEDAISLVSQSETVFEKCKIVPQVASVQVITKPSLLNGFNCKAGSVFTSGFSWFSQQAIGNNITVFFVSSLGGDSCGCSFPATNWMLVSMEERACTQCAPSTIVHEYGHIAGLTHSDDTNNIMHSDQASHCGDNITKWQCCRLTHTPFLTTMTEQQTQNVQLMASNS